MKAFAQECPDLLIGQQTAAQLPWFHIVTVIGKLGWIKPQRKGFEGQARQSEREMVSGESHYFLGRRYRLRVTQYDDPPSVALPNKTAMILSTRPESSAAQRDRILQRWYRAQLKTLIPPLLEKWQSALGVRVDDWGIKKMKTKWGSCNVDARRIWFNLELAKKPIAAWNTSPSMNWFICWSGIITIASPR